MDKSSCFKGGCGSDENKNSLGLGPCFGVVKFEPRFHSAISAGLRGVRPRRSRVLLASLSAAAAAATAAAAPLICSGVGVSHGVSFKKKS